MSYLASGRLLCVTATGDGQKKLKPVIIQGESKLNASTFIDSQSLGAGGNLLWCVRQKHSFTEDEYSSGRSLKKALKRFF